MHHGKQENARALAAFSLENELPLRYKKTQSGRLTQGESATFTR